MGFSMTMYVVYGYFICVTYIVHYLVFSYAEGKVNYDHKSYG